MQNIVKFDVKNRRDPDNDDRWYHCDSFSTQEEAEKFILGQRHMWTQGEEVAIFRVLTTFTAVMTIKAEVKLTKRDL